MYSKFDHIAYARKVFDQTLDRDEGTWNNMMSAFVRVGCYYEAQRFFCVMRGFGINPSGYVLASLITACDRSDYMVDEGLQVHGFVIKYGFFSDVFVGTSLLHFYGTCGTPSSARKIFDEMTERNVVSWTSLMVGYLDHGDPLEVLDIYQRMRHDGVYGNQNTIATVLSSCWMLGDELLGYQMLGDVIKSGLDHSVSAANALVSMFGSFGDMEEACYVFDNMSERDTISWNAIIAANAHNGLSEESLKYFCWMRHFHMEINSITLSTLLSVCGSVYNLKWGRGIHAIIVKSGRESNVCTCNSLLAMYSYGGRSTDALQIFTLMLQLRHEINYVTVTIALAACSSLEYITEGKILHSLLITSGIHNNLIVGNALITMYGKFSMLVEAKQVSQGMARRDEVSWNALIGSYADNRKSDEAFKAFKLMKKEGIPANYITIINVLGACSIPDDLLKHGMPIHAHVVKGGFESDTYVQNSLITMYADCGDPSSSNKIFDGLAYRNSITWNAIVAANARNGPGEEALKLILKMRDAGENLDQFTFSMAFAVSANLAVLDAGKQLHCLVIKHGFESDSYVLNAAMDMYGKCGEMDDVLRILPHPTTRSKLSWNIVISAYARHGCFHQAKESFQEMLRLGMKPDHVTFVSLLSACSHRGMVDEGLAYYSAMTTEFGVPAGIEHCVCIIDLLGRSGRLVEAEAFIEEMPVPPNDVVWRSLLAACKTHGKPELGRKAAEHLFEVDSSDDSAYVLYSNVCATTNRWEHVENVRKRMESQSIKKQPACSWIVLKDKVTSFGMGDQSHSQTEKINSKLAELVKMIKEAGYVPDTTNALQDTDEEQKEHNLWKHSERIALAYGLIHTPEGAPLRIFKNLRVCADCHSVYKYVSNIVGRKIILRDPYRFHHFNGGSCSCFDYW